jgi:uncharacterized protein YecE (DUF72 family)
MDLFPDHGASGSEFTLEPGPVRFGTSSFSSKDWVGPFYPPGTRPPDYLRIYATRYDTVEIDATYYGVPRAQTVAGWNEKTPEGFIVAAKVPRDIVHGGDGARPDPERVLDPDATYAVRDQFLGVMAGLGEKLGPLLIQFPFFNARAFPEPGPFRERLDRFLGDLPGGFCIAVEIRNRDWLDAAFADLLRAHGAALVLTDQAWMPHGDEVESRFDPVTAPFSYIRLLGDHKEMDRITTTWDREVVDRTPRLRRWAEVLARLFEREVPAFVYANNHYAGHAPATLDRLQRLFADRAMEDRLNPEI